MVKIFKQLCEFTICFICSPKPLLGWKTLKLTAKSPWKKNGRFIPNQKRNLSPRWFNSWPFDAPVGGHLYSPLKKGHVFTIPKKVTSRIARVYLVGGWTNPFEKYARQNGFIFRLTGVKSTKTFELPPPRYGIFPFPPWLKPEKLASMKGDGRWPTPVLIRI